ncbi:hypothetical protein G4G27_11700 [Sphingomonas sp. So64.6b]|uniref:hypothetical protein n=1 Tax=Sphingomonas sp. So64.6b TaxID=2997354 RepID=UPI0016033C28|nr:hypothetical protein [Sphingomonas sp. So64.6b]QNA84579.1 hypothetical protein G4G27_11700 [Sphingomonas sp. So64.6b]
MELTKTGFKRLVWLSILLTLPMVSLAIWEVVDPAWSEFDDQFEALRDRSFQSLLPAHIWMTGGGLLLSAQLVASFALLGFRGWSKPLFTISTIGLIIFDLVADAGPSYMSGAGYALSALDNAVAGTILLLLYSADHGAEWFKSKPDIAETFATE